MKVVKEITAKLLDDNGNLKLLISARFGDKIFGQIKPLVIQNGK